MTDTTPQAALLPCPCCGSKAKLIRTQGESLWSHDQVEWTQAQCTNEDCGITTENRCEGWQPTPSETWNTRAKLQAATPAVIDRPAGQKSGHYFKFERGEWVVFNDGEVKHYPLSGLAYSGSLTHEKRVQLDKLISDFIDGKTATPAEPAQVVADAVADEFEPGHWTVSAQRAIQEHPQYVLKLLARLKRLESEPAQAVESKLPEFFAQYEYAPDWTVLVSVYQRVPDSEPKLIHREELVSQEPKPAQAVELPDERAAFESEIGCAEKWGAQITI